MLNLRAFLLLLLLPPLLLLLPLLREVYICGLPLFLKLLPCLTVLRPVLLGFPMLPWPGLRLSKRDDRICRMAIHYSML